MERIEISVSGNTATVAKQCPVVAGTVGLSVGFVFDEVWSGLSKTGVFRANGKTMDCVNITDTAVVPWELLKTPGCRLWAGVYGTNADGNLQIPTLWADLGVIQPGADPTGDVSADPTLPVWEQISKDAVSPVKYIDGSNAAPPVVLMDLAPGSYVLNGTFAYSNNPENGQFPFGNTLVQIDELDEDQKTVSFQVADEIICIFITNDSYEFKRYWLADLGNGGGSADGAVLYTEQTLTPEQQTQARENIGAVSCVEPVFYSHDSRASVWLEIADDETETGWVTEAAIAFFAGGGDHVLTRLCRVADGKFDDDAATVGQLKDAVGNIETALDSIIAIQQSLIGGGSQ